MTEKEWQAARAEIKAIMQEMNAELAGWEERARALQAVYTTCNGQLTDELKKAIENIIAYISVDVFDDL